jgi:hypothetical protein
MNSTSSRRLAPALIATIAVSLAALTGCAPAVPLAPGAPTSSSPGASPTSGNGGSGSSGSTQAGSCAEFTSGSFAKLVNAPIGKPLVVGSDSSGGIACWYGIGSNAGLTGSAIEKATEENILITVIGIDGQSQYAQGTGSDVNLGAVTSIGGIGDKAAYNTSALSGGVPQLYALKGGKYCHVMIAAASSELVDHDQASIATDEGALCEDAFNH